jgi:hypothetical protein
MHADGRWTNGPGVGARAFNGTTDRIDFPAIGDLSAGAFTLSAWVYLDSYPANGYILCLHESGDTQYGIVMNFNDAANRYFNLTIHGAADMVRGSAANGAVSGAWTHYLATWSGGAISDATRAKLYRGGVELSYSTPTNGAGTPAGALGKLSLGGRIYSDTRNFPGKIAQVAVWNRALSAAEIAGLASGLAADRAAAAGLQFYFKGSTAGLAATPGGTGVADGTSQQSGVGAGPSIIY